MKPGYWRGLRAAAAIGIAALIVWRVDIGAIASHLSQVDPAWLTGALALSLPQILLSAWRWQLTSQRLGLCLPFAQAIREYYLATWLNQLLPGGMMGDAARAWRHGRDSLDGSGAAHAVIIERASGQIVMWLVALATLLASPPLRSGIANTVNFDQPVHIDQRMAGSVVAVIAVSVLAGLVATRSGVLQAAGKRLATAARLGLLEQRVWRRQLGSSLLVVTAYIGMFVCCGLAIGIARPVADWGVLVPPVLMAMALPLSIAGWGLREGAAAVVWSLAGLPAHEGIAISLTYGAVVFATSMPGALFLHRDRRPARPLKPGPPIDQDRTACRCRAYVFDSADAAPRQGSRSRAG